MERSGLINASKEDGVCIHLALNRETLKISPHILVFLVDIFPNLLIFLEDIINMFLSRERGLEKTIAIFEVVNSLPGIYFRVTFCI